MNNNQIIQQMKTLITQLNNYSYSYHVLSTPLVPDEEYDKLYDALEKLEQETGIILANSPTQKVGGTTLPFLTKVIHTAPMLSAQKTTNIKEINQFIKSNVVASYKYDGITVCVRYSGGKMVKAITRGDGYTGEDITHTARFITNLPMIIPFNGELEIRGEAVIGWDNYAKINVEGTIGHPRSAVSGLLRSLNSTKAKDKNIELFVFSLTNWEDFPNIKTTKTSFDWLTSLGFTVAEHELLTADELAESFVNTHDRTTYPYPTDGYVFTMNSLMDYKKAGNTAHHPRGMMALKPAFEAYDTTLRSIEWQVGRTGVLTPVANFDEVEINNSIVTKASVHNLSIIDSIFGKPYMGQKIKIGLANLIIPMVYEAEKAAEDEAKSYITIPSKCPVCGGEVEIIATNNSKTLHCTNSHCPAKMLAQFSHFVSKECMDIKGMSEATLEVLINAGLINKYADIYHLNEHKDKIVSMDGFGEQSYQNLIDAIDKSRHTNLERFINAMGIPNIGKSASKVISKAFKGDIDEFLRTGTNYDYTSLDDFGEVMHDAMQQWFFNEHIIDEGLVNELVFEKEEANTVMSDYVKDRTWVITGALSKPRKYYEDYITGNGGKLSGSVSKKTYALITNSTESTSKYVKAQELGIEIMNEEEFCKHVGLQW